LRIGQIGLAFNTMPVSGSILSNFRDVLDLFGGRQIDEQMTPPAVDHLLENHHSLKRRFRLAEETGSCPAPKEQPPRKLSGNKDRKTTDTLESGRAQARSTEEERRCDRAPNLSGFVTEGASCRRVASTMRDPMEP